ncbi:hypothetical protein VNI00_004670 [Paramarasmius palmivorus]|uniref:Nephrocystin 3-like N-terminal domain-containing protein n=1 Tax=Paramarasmius palmivorus TaxID=297713 RepID=A0AAW0DIH8_9AGAR
MSDFPPGCAELQREMIIHRRKYINHHFELSIKTEHLALPPDSLAPTITSSPAVYLEQDGPHRDSQDRARKGDDSRPSAESEIGNTQAKPHQRLGRSIDGVSARPADSSSSSISSPTTAPHATQTENLITPIANDGSRGHVEEKASHTMVSEMDTFSTQEETRQQTDRLAHEVNAMPDRPASALALLLPNLSLDIHTEGHPPPSFDYDSAVRVHEELAKFGDEMETRRVQTEKQQRIYEATDAIIEVLDKLSEVHEIARAASIVVSGIYRVIKAKHKQNEAIVTLYDVMIEMFKLAVDKKALNKQGYFTKLFNEIVRQSEECYVFLSNHMFQGYLRQVLDLWNTPAKIAEFKAAFEQLKKRFIETQIEFTAVTIINTQKAIKSLGFHSRLAAFVRFDRSAYNTAGEFVRALAFLLAGFDERFSKPIAEVVARSRHIAQNTDLNTQVEELLINPLQGLSDEIAKEGRIVVLVDGIDECSRSDQVEANFRGQLLELFANNKFRLLPFLCFVLASRPEEDIVAYLQNLVHIHHFPLDHTSLETRQDINYFLAKSFEQHPSLHVLDHAIKSSAIEKLAEHASGLFVWAATIIGFIKENAVQRLKVFTENEPPKNALHALTVLYETALNSLVNEQGDNDIRQNICMALGLIMVDPGYINSPTVPILHGLSNHVDPENNPDIVSTFYKLRSLVTEENNRYQLLHKSFDDFLTSKDRAGHWYIDMEKYEAILYETMITCTMDHLKQDLSLYQSLQQKLERFLLGYVAEKLQHDSEFMQKAWLGASRLQHIRTDPIVVKDFFNIMLYDAALAGKVTKTNADDQHALEWEVDNIYMSVFVQMAGGSNVYEEIVEVLDKNPIPPVVSLSAGMEMPIKIVSGGRIRMKTRSVDEGKEASTKEFIEWGEYKGGKWVLIVEPQDRALRRLW